MSGVQIPNAKTAMKNLQALTKNTTFVFAIVVLFLLVIIMDISINIKGKKYGLSSNNKPKEFAVKTSPDTYTTVASSAANHKMNKRSMASTAASHKKHMASSAGHPVNTNTNANTYQNPD